MFSHVHVGFVDFEKLFFCIDFVVVGVDQRLDKALRLLIANRLHQTGQ